MNKALFLDRDGIINEDKGYTHRIEEFIFRDGIFELCKAAQDAHYLLVIITNQAGIARGYYTEEDFRRLTDWMIVQFSEHDIEITDVEFCPYHPVHGIGQYKRDSFRRKPHPGMIIDACKKYDIVAHQSIMVGDNETDILAAKSAGIEICCLLTKNNNTIYPKGTKVFSYNDLSGVTEYLKRIFRNTNRK